MILDPFELIAGLSAAIWAAELGRRPRWQAVPLWWLRLGHVVIRDLADGQLSLRAMSLVYTTLLSLVPLLAISFSVLKGFGVHNQIEPMLLSLLEPLGEKSVEITTRVIEFVDNMKAGVLGSVGLGLLIYTVISLMQKIERAFNFTWRVGAQRPFARRFGDYLSVILIGPVLVFSSLGVTASVKVSPQLKELSEIAPLGLAIELGSGLVPYLLVVFAFTFVYLFMPNTRVSFKAAFAGAAIAGLMWHVAGWVFASFVVDSSSYAAVYSAFATLILFMIWLYLSWLILLLGADIAYYVQHPERVTLARESARPSPASRAQLALTFALRVGEEHLRARPGPTVHALAAEGFVPPETALPILAALERAAIVVRTAARPERYVPARALEAIPVKSVLDAIALSDDDGREDAFSVTPEARVAALLEDLDQAADAALAGRTLRDLAQMTVLPRRAGKTGT